MQEALESSGVLDDAQWLTYWLIYALLTVFERFTFRLLYYIPFFAEMRLGLLVWLAVPPFLGASKLYAMARPHLVKAVAVINEHVASIQGKESAAAPDGAPQPRSCAPRAVVSTVCARRRAF